MGDPLTGDIVFNPTFEPPMSQHDRDVWAVVVEMERFGIRVLALGADRHIAMLMDHEMPEVAIGDVLRVFNENFKARPA